MIITATVATATQREGELLPPSREVDSCTCFAAREETNPSDYNRRRLMLPVTALLFENPSFTMMLTFLVVVDGTPATL